MVVKAVFNYLKLVVTVAVVIAAVVYHKELKCYYDNFINVEEERENVYTPQRLVQYDGIKHNRLYLAVLGTIFDVTEGKRHYEKGAAYHYFIGKDGSRSLVTGDFQDESNEKDHVLDLSCNDLITLLNWRNTFKRKYTEVGVLLGRFFDKNGQETTYMKEFYNKIKQCEIEKENSRKKDQKYPPCNIAWSADEGTRVWCTTLSGGVKRSWTGVPRQLFSPGEDKPHCVCLNKDEDSVGLIKEYDDCPKSSSECIIKT